MVWRSLSTPAESYTSSRFITPIQLFYINLTHQTGLLMYQRLSEWSLFAVWPHGSIRCYQSVTDVTDAPLPPPSCIDRQRLLQVWRGSMAQRRAAAKRPEIVAREDPKATAVPGVGAYVAGTMLGTLQN